MIARSKFRGMNEVTDVQSGKHPSSKMGRHVAAMNQHSDGTCLADDNENEVTEEELCDASGDTTRVGCTT